MPNQVGGTVCVGTEINYRGASDEGETMNYMLFLFKIFYY